MKILVAGANGFIGKNLVETLNNIRMGKDKSFGISQDIIIYQCGRDTSREELEEYCKDCDIVYNLAGVNRPREVSEFKAGNYDFTVSILNLLKKNNNCCEFMLASSTQATLDNEYGKSKKVAEDAVFDYGKETGANVYVYRFANVFGKWCKPNYNSVVATFCHNVAHDLPIQINDANAELNLIYIDDLIEEMVAIIKGNANRLESGYCDVYCKHEVTLGRIADLINSFKESRKNLLISDMTEGSFEKKLYATYLSYLPEDAFSYPLKMNVDERGSFTEILRTIDRGQVSVNISKPGITKGEHWHHTKNEKFVVVSGKGLIQFRKVGCDKIIEYHVSGEKIEVIDIPTGYTHNIINEGETDMVTVMWSNECFNPEKPDTYALKVNEQGK